MHQADVKLILKLLLVFSGITQEPTQEDVGVGLG